MAQTISVTEIELYEVLKNKLGDKEAKILVEYVEASAEKKFEEKKDILATKEDILATKEEIKNLEVKIEEVRSDVIKWMFLFWIGQLASLIVILQIKKMSNSKRRAWERETTPSFYQIRYLSRAFRV